MALPVHAAPLAAIDLDNIAQVLLVFLFLVVPIAKKVFEATRKGGPTPRPTPPGRRPPTRPAAGAPARPFTWEDLMSGRVPEREPVASVPGETPGRADVAPPVFEDMQGAMPEPLLPDFAREDELEALGGGQGATMAFPDELYESSSSGEEVAEGLGAPGKMAEASGGFQAWEEGALATEAARSPWRPRRGEWRRALIMSELFAVPATMRRKGCFPGPPLGLL